MIVVTGVTPTAPTFRPFDGATRLVWIARLINLILLGLPLLLVAFVARQNGDPSLTLPMIGMILIALFLWRLTQRWYGRASWLEMSKAPSWVLSNTWVLDQEGVTITDGLVSTTLRWAAVIEVREESDRVLFMFSPVQGHVLPIRFLDAGARQLEQIRALVAEVQASGRFGRTVDYQITTPDNA